MSMQDRDWYRKSHAEKNGMIYDDKTARYLKKPVLGSKSTFLLKTFTSDSRPAISPPELHWSLKVLTVLAVFALLFMARYFFMR